MKHHDLEETIAAISSAPGEGGIGVIRISGAEAGSILQMVFRPTLSEAQMRERERKMRYGKIVNPVTGTSLDEVLAVFMPAPATYTRENIAEIYCHGGWISLRQIMDLICRCGARPAEPGEFTKRAFLNGRIDLTQAEAVIDLIRAKTEVGHEIAYDQLAGRLFEKIRQWRETLLRLLVLLAANLDFSEEDIEIISRAEIKTELAGVEAELEQIAASANTGRVLRDGLRVTIAGRPNVGKSSLLNTLLRESRAIVTDIPGTTRDLIEETLDLDGLAICLTDTAGVRETEDSVERLGMQKAREAIDRAELVLFVVDASEALTDDDRAIAALLRDKPVIVLINKVDLVADTVDRKTVAEGTGELRAACGEQEALLRPIFPNATVIRTSMKSSEGLEQLTEELRRFIYGGEAKSTTHPIVSNARHIYLLNQATEALRLAVQAVERSEPLDLIEVDIRETWSLLGEITGETVHDEIIDQIFARFCLGK